MTSEPPAELSEAPTLDQAKKTPRKGKWIDGLAPEQPAGEAGRRVLEVRLRAAWHWLPLAAERSDGDIEYVHQLRVSNRRAVAALKVFRELLPENMHQSLKDGLRSIRRAAGEARDWDVLAERLKVAPRDEVPRQGAGDLAPRELEVVLRRIADRRRRAQEPICQVHARLVDEAFDREIQRALSQIGRREAESNSREPCFQEAARGQLAEGVERLFAAAAGPMADPDELHQFRIRAKKLRYAMEVFAGAFGAEFRGEVYPIVEQMQKQLGRITDHTMAERRYRELRESADGDEAEPLQRLIDAHQQAAIEAEARFREWWTADRMDDLRRRLAPFC
jgi:CHAD domain-containing protein